MTINNTVKWMCAESGICAPTARTFKELFRLDHGLLEVAADDGVYAVQVVVQAAEHDLVDLRTFCLNCRAAASCRSLQQVLARPKR